MNGAALECIDELKLILHDVDKIIETMENGGNITQWYDSRGF